jgi:hypothetical protein
MNSKFDLPTLTCQADTLRREADMMHYSLRSVAVDSPEWVAVLAKADSLDAQARALDAENDRRVVQYREEFAQFTEEEQTSARNNMDGAEWVTVPFEYYAEYWQGLVVGAWTLRG